MKRGDTVPELGKIIEEEMKKQGINATQLAAKVGNSRQAVSRWVQTGSLTVGNLKALLRHLDIDLYRAFGVEQKGFSEIKNEQENRMLQTFRRLSNQQREDLLNYAIDALFTND